MKKIVILLLILAAGLTAYPQSSSRSRESKSKSSSSVNRSSSSKSKKATPSKSSSSSSRSKATKSKPSNSSKATQSRSSSNSGASRAKATQSRSSQASRSQANQSRSSQASRSQANQSRSSQSNRSAVESRADRPSSSKSVTVQSKERNNSRSMSGNSAARTVNRSDSPNKAVSRAVSSNSGNRSNRSGNKVYERNDGQKFRHENDRIVANRKYKVDFKNSNDLRRSNEFRRVYNNYESWHRNRYHRHVVVRNYYVHAPLSLEIRRVRYPYRRPIHMDLCWTPFLHNQFMYYYPMQTNWSRNGNYGDYIESISTYEAQQYVGSVKRVYGKVEEVYYSPEDKTYTLYFGAPFPYHDFSVVIPKNVAREISWSPSWHFEDEHVWVVGLIDYWEEKAEIVIHDEGQIKRY